MASPSTDPLGLHGFPRLLAIAGDSCSACLREPREPAELFRRLIPFVRAAQREWGGILDLGCANAVNVTKPR